MRGDCLAELADGLRRDRNVRTVVLRIPSPGGGAAAFGHHRRGLEELAVEQPLMVSMEALAASGDHWNADPSSCARADLQRSRRPVDRGGRWACAPRTRAPACLVPGWSDRISPTPGPYAGSAWMKTAPAPRSLVRRPLALATGLLLALVAAELVVRTGVHVREVGPTFSEWHPEDGIHLRRSIRVRRIHPEFTMRLTTNSHGYRGPELPARVERSVLCLGDSFTMGYGVDDDEAFPARLAGLLPPGWTLVNAGIGGVGNGRWPHVLERERERLRPKVVVLQVCGNDPADNLAEGLYSLDEAGQLVRHAPGPPSFARRVQAVLDRVPGLSYLRLVGLGRQIANRPARPGAPTPEGAAVSGAPLAEPGLDLTLALIRRTVEQARAEGAEAVLLVVEALPALQAALEALALELGVACLGVPGKSERPELYFATDGHWNAAGHAFAVELLWGELRSPRYGVVSGPAGGDPTGEGR